MDNLRPALHKIVYSYGSPSNGIYGQLVLGWDGTVFGYDHPNERRWQFSGTSLELLSEQSIPTSRYTAVAGNIWSGRVVDSVRPDLYHLSRWPLMLTPVLDLSDPLYTPIGEATCPSVLVNTIPKSGTYFLSATLERLGCPFTGLHFTDDLTQGLFDFRGLTLADREMDPGFARVEVSLELTFAAMGNQHSVAHIHAPALLASLSRMPDRVVINVVRNLRDVLRSLYFFKLRQVPPLDGSESRWRSAPESERFLAFMHHFMGTDIANIARVADCILSLSDQSYIRYEDASKAAESAFPRHLSGFYSVAEFLTALDTARDSPTATLSPSTHRTQVAWPTECERLFESSGLRELNRRLKYE